MKPLAISVLLCLFVVACAKKPGDIRPIAIPVSSYAGLSCDEMQGALVKELAALEALNDEQSRAASTDAFFFATLGVPMASATGGDKETEIAASLGRVQALRGAIAKKNCPPLDTQTN